MRISGPRIGAVLVAVSAVACSSFQHRHLSEASDPQVYKRRMRELVISLSRYARAVDPEFIVIPQNGNELLTVDGTAGGVPALDYIRAIDGVGREDLFYGYTADNRETPQKALRHMLPYLHLALESGLSVLVVDYCRQSGKINDSYRKNHREGFISFASPQRDLSAIPVHPSPAFAAHGGEVRRLAEARNFLFLIDPASFSGRRQFLSALRRTSYDLIIIDAFIDGPSGPEWLEPEDVGSLKRKPGGARRLVVCYLSIGEAEAYRYYWDTGWDRNRDGRPDPKAPDWLVSENPAWQGNYKVRYWDAAWQAILFGGPESYLDQIISRGFDGVYLDIIDAFEYFESGES